MASNPDYLQEMMERTRGLRGVPVILVGKMAIRGFDPRKLAAALGIDE